MYCLGGSKLLVSIIGYPTLSLRMRGGSPAGFNELRNSMGVFDNVFGARGPVNQFVDALLIWNSSYKLAVDSTDGYAFGGPRWPIDLCIVTLQIEEYFFQMLGRVVHSISLSFLGILPSSRAKMFSASAADVLSPSKCAYIFVLRLKVLT